MKKLLILLFAAAFLFGCIAESPWGEFRLRPDNATLNELEQIEANIYDAGEVAPLNPANGAIMFFDQGSGSFRLVIDGVPAEYDEIGVVLRPGEDADATNWADLFVGGYPAHSPRDVVIKTRAVMGERRLESWRAQTTAGNLERKSLVIEIRDERRYVVGRVYLLRAWPSEYQLIVTPNSFEEVIVFAVEAVEIEEY